MKNVIMSWILKHCAAAVAVAVTVAAEIENLDQTVVVVL